MTQHSNCSPDTKNEKNAHHDGVNVEGQSVHGLHTHFWTLSTSCTQSSCKLLNLQLDVLLIMVCDDTILMQGTPLQRVKALGSHRPLLDKLKLHVSVGLLAIL